MFHFTYSDILAGSRCVLKCCVCRRILDENGVYVPRFPGFTDVTHLLDHSRRLGEPSTEDIGMVSFISFMYYQHGKILVVNG